jgi:hypothetical protein
MYKNLTLILFVTIIFCFSALCNKFPLVTAETGSYINCGFSRILPADSTIIYSLFIAHSSWGLTLWLVIFSQSLIVSVVLYYYFKYFSGSDAFQPYYLACVFFLACFTYTSVITSTIGPGVFAAVSILSMGLLLFAKKLNKIDYSIIIIIAVFSISMDISYLLSILLIILVNCVSILIKKRNGQSTYVEISFKRGIVSMAVIAVSFLLICLSNFLFGGVFGPVKDIDVFRANRLRKEGMAGVNLERVAKMKENAGKAGMKYLLENVKTQNNAGAENKLYPKTISKLSSEPGSWYDLTKKAIKEFPAQITALDINSYKNTGESTETFKAIFNWYDWEGREFLIARQFQGWLTFQYLNCAQMAAVFISCIVFFFAIRKQSSHKVFFFYFFLSVMVMVFVNLLFYGKNHQMTEQVIWIVLLSPCLYISKYYLWKTRIEPDQDPCCTTITNSKLSTANEKKYC